MASVVFNREKLLTKLEMLLPAVGRNSLLPFFQAFQWNRNGTLFASNGVMTLRTPLGQTLETDCGIPAIPLIDILKMLKEESVTITDLDKEEIEVTSGRTNVKLVKRGYRDFSVTEKFNTELHGDDVRKFLQKVQSCCFCAMPNKFYDVWSGIVLHKGKILASDRYRICKIVYPVDIPKTVSIPINTIDVLLKYQEDIESIAFSESCGILRAIFKDGGQTQFYSSLHISEIEDVCSFFPSEDEEAIPIPFNSEIREIIERHLLFQKEVNSVDREIEITLSGKKMIIHSQTPTLGEMNDEVPAKNNTAEVKIFVSPDFLVTPLQINEVLLYPSRNSILMNGEGEVQYLVALRGE